MSWTYSGDPSQSDLDMVRFLIADTDTEDQQLSNEEISTYLSMYTSVDQTVLYCTKYLMTKYARECDYKIGPESVTASQRYKQYKELYTSLKADVVAANTTPQVEKGSTIFSVGFTDNGLTNG